MAKQCLTAHRGGADNGAIGKRVNRREGPDQRIAPVLTRQHRGNGGAIGKDGLHILHRMDRRITAAIKQPPLQILDEQPLAAGIGKRAVEDLVTARCQRQRFGGQRGKAVTDDVRLRQRQRRSAASQNERAGGKDIGQCSHSRL